MLNEKFLSVLLKMTESTENMEQDSGENPVDTLAAVMTRLDLASRHGIYQFVSCAVDSY